jgi:hypothetical protein
MPLTQADLEYVKDLAHKMGVEALEKVGERPFAPLLALAALTTAACEVAVVTDVAFTQLMELVSLHYQSAVVGVTVQELEAKFGVKMPVGKLPIDQEPS